jgi:hypothetical protein
MNQFIPEPPAIEGLDLSDIVLSCRAEVLLQEIFGQPRYIVLEICISEWIKVVEWFNLCMMMTWVDRVFVYKVRP